MAFTYAGRWAGGAAYFVNTQGLPTPNRAITVYARATTTLVTLYVDRTKGATTANPFTTDARGNGQFFADPGEYDLLPANGVTIPVTVDADPFELDTAVHIAGTETITGAKTFSVAPVVPANSFGEDRITNLVADLAGKATDSLIVHKAGAETITGIKTISADLYATSGRPWADVIGKGADPLGVADSTAAINAAITAMVNVGGGVVFFPWGVYLVTSQIVVPDEVTLRGCGRYVSIIKASASFPINTPVVKMGTTAIVFWCRLENIQVDANDVTGSTCIYSDRINEQSGLFNVFCARPKNKGVWIGTPGSGVGAQNFEINGIEVGLSPTSGASAIGIHFDLPTASFRCLRNFTINSNDGATTLTGTAIQVDGAFGDIYDGHVEHMPVGILLGPVRSATGTTVRNVTGGPSLTDIVKVSNATTQNGYNFRSIITTPGATNSVNDQITGYVNSSNEYGYGVGFDTGNAYSRSYEAAGSIGDRIEKPAQRSLLAWNFSPTLAKDSPVGGTGYVVLSKIWVPPIGLTVTAVLLRIATGGAGLTLGQSLVGIYDSSGTLLRQSADQSTAFLTTGTKSVSLTSSIAISGALNKFIWVGFLSNGTTPPGVSGITSQIDLLNANLSAAFSFSAYFGGATATTLASFTPSSVTQWVSAQWMALQ